MDGLYYLGATGMDRPQLVQFITEAINARGDLFMPGGAEAMAEEMLAEYERTLACRLAPRDICRTCGGKTPAAL